MSYSQLHGKKSWTDEAIPLIRFLTIYAEGRHWNPRFGDKTALKLIKLDTDKKVSFLRAYRGWRASGAKEEKELGEGRAFIRWLHKYGLSIEWKEDDFEANPIFTGENSPKFDPDDEMSEGQSFTIRPVKVGDRNIKLYLQDEDMLNLIHLPYGEEEDFLKLTAQYISQRFQWEKWRAPAPKFLDWIIGQGKRPFFCQGQVGFWPYKGLTSL